MVIGHTDILTHTIVRKATCHAQRQTHNLPFPLLCCRRLFEIVTWGIKGKWYSCVKA